MSYEAPAQTAPAAQRVLVQRSGRPMATDVSVQLAARPEQEAAANEAADACMAWFDEVNACLSRFDPESELSYLNRSGGAWFTASPTLYAAVAAAVRAARITDGLFDPTLLPQIEAHGYDRDFTEIAHHEAPLAEVSAALIQPSAQAWRDIELDDDVQRVRLPADVRLDLGGIAKGWAADIAFAAYCDEFPGVLINVGGDLRASGGPAEGSAWTIGLSHPHYGADSVPAPTSEWAGILTLGRGAVATSGAIRRWWLRDGVVHHHLLDPRTGQPIPLWTSGESAADSQIAGKIATVTALAPTAERTEIAAKLALLRGREQALHAVESAWERYGGVGPDDDPDAGIALIIALASGEIVLSRNARAWLATWGTEGANVPMLVTPEDATALHALTLKGSEA